MVESKFVDLGGVKISYGEGAPNGPVLVFLHGFPGSWSEHGPVYELLEPRYHVFAPTLRGMGMSEKSGPYSIPVWIEEVGRFIRDVTGSGILGVGHSAGSWFGLAAACSDAGLFSAFVSLDHPLDPLGHVEYHQNRQATVMAMARAMRAAADVDDLRKLLADVPLSTGDTLGESIREDDLTSTAADLYLHDPEIFAAWVDDSLESFIVIPELQRWPGGYRSPLFFVDGDPSAGSMVKAAGVKYNMERYPWAERVEMGGLDHGLGLWEEPGPVVAEIRKFFDQSG